MSLVQHSVACTVVVFPVRKQTKFRSRHRGLERGFERSLERGIPFVRVSDMAEEGEIFEVRNQRFLSRFFVDLS